MRKLSIYIDTSVVGGCLDKEYEQESLALFEMARKGDIIFVVSDVVLDELDKAPQPVQEILTLLPSHAQKLVESDYESENLCEKYLDAGVVGPASYNDAHHVAIATVERTDMIVSWNFRHIVHFDKIRGFNAVNIREGYPLIEIRSPKEVV